MTLGQKIKSRRQELGLTQVELADASMISQPYISYLEKDEVNPSAVTLCDIAKVLKTSVEELLESEKRVV